MDLYMAALTSNEASGRPLICSVAQRLVLSLRKDVHSSDEVSIDKYLPLLEF